MEPTVYAYSEPHLYLKDLLESKKKQNPLFSLRAWSMQMGFRGHTALLFLINGQRKIRTEHIDRLVRGLKLQSEEEKYWRTLVQLRSAKSQVEKNELENQLKLLMVNREQAILETEKFKLVADWIHMAILEMTRLKDFQNDPEWILSRLHFKESRTSVESAIERLLKMGLLEIKDGKLTKTNERLTTPKDRASESIREHHRQVMQNAIQAIESQSVDERVLNSSTMTIDVSKMNEAKDLIRKFRGDMAKLMEKSDGDETYQLAIQFFKLTEKK